MGYKMLCDFLVVLCTMPRITRGLSFWSSTVCQIKAWNSIDWAGFIENNHALFSYSCVTFFHFGAKTWPTKYLWLAVRLLYTCIRENIFFKKAYAFSSLVLVVTCNRMKSVWFTKCYFCKTAKKAYAFGNRKKTAEEKVHVEMIEYNGIRVRAASRRRECISFDLDANKLRQHTLSNFSSGLGWPAKHVDYQKTTYIHFSIFAAWITIVYQLLVVA